ncbi:hypothetical protein PN462_02605 [Spirulina sp. CS-785/01]|uniref:hypothetical protein n=1 Tax=Spirulina sp. CS-785/01 TaxID=3021716 RepID=UPI00232F3212|nr:hypothetical protein [Spirulina sp. CS-785/01]MDB9311977.1 hypothetical protein [Spirulina sp. CS-785/01]
MRDPWSAFKQQPWLPLLQVAGIDTLVALLLEILLVALWLYVPGVGAILNPFFSSPLSLLLPFAATFGFGVLAVFLCEIAPQRIPLNTGSLWALVLCLLGGLLLKTSLPLPIQLIQLSHAGFMGVLLGVFWKGRPYWF